MARTNKIAPNNTAAQSGLINDIRPSPKKKSTNTAT